MPRKVPESVFDALFPKPVHTPTEVARMLRFHADDLALAGDPLADRFYTLADQLDPIERPA